MKKTASSKNNRNPSPNHCHPRTQEVSGLLGFLSNILLGIFGPILNPLLCRFRGHDPEPFYKEGKYSIHTHRCSRCHATLGIGRMNWYSIPPAVVAFLELQITAHEWQSTHQPSTDQMRVYTQQQQEDYFYEQSLARVRLILAQRAAETKAFYPNLAICESPHPSCSTSKN